MRKRRITYPGILAFMLHTSLCYAQTVKSELLNISKAFLDIKQIGIISDTKCFNSSQMSRPEMEYKMEFYKKNDKTYTKYTNTEMVVTDHYKINLNTASKQMFVYDLEPGSSKNQAAKPDKGFEADFLSALDTTFKLYKEVKLKPIDEKSGEIVFVFKTGMYKEASVIYDPVSYLIKSYRVFLDLNYNAELKKNKIDLYQIEYTYVPVQKINVSLFDEKEYFSIQKNTIKASKKYSNYQVISHIKNK